jgi:DNA-binding transcriptional MerR regulator
MKFNFVRLFRQRLGVAIDWRVRDVLEAEREATVELGQIFVKNAANLTDQQRLLEQRVADLEKRLAELEKGR